MAEYGLPGVSEVAIQRDKEIFRHKTGSELIEGGTFVLGAAEVLASGTVVGRVTATGKYKAYAGANVDGSEVAVGVLRFHIERPDGAAGDTLGEIIFGQADLKLDQLVGLDAGAITDLGGKSDTVRNSFKF